MSELLAFIQFDSSEAGSRQVDSDVPRGIQVDNLLTLYLEEKYSTPVARKGWTIALRQRTQYYGCQTRRFEIQIKEPRDGLLELLGKCLSRLSRSGDFACQLNDEILAVAKTPRVSRERENRRGK